MKTRIISAAVMLAIFIPCLIFSSTVVFDIVVTLICLLATFEMLNCFGYVKRFEVFIPSMIAALILPLLVRVFKLGSMMPDVIIIFAVIYLLLLFSFAVFSKGKIALKDMSLVFSEIFFIIFGFTSILSIRYFEGGEYFYLLIFISAWITDTGAYFTGVKLGKTKLIPDVSPKKTVEGAIGGIASCVLVFVIYAAVLNIFFDKTPNFLIYIVLGLILSVVSMIGDLIASLIKRIYKKKDYSNLIPGHGGIMDRFDSILATASVFYVLLNLPFIFNKML